MLQEMSLHSFEGTPPDPSGASASEGDMRRVRARAKWSGLGLLCGFGVVLEVELL